MTNEQGTMNVNAIISKALKAGFKEELTMPHPDRFEYPNIMILTLTATKGKHSGDVVDVWYDFDSGDVVHHSIFSQFKNTKATFQL